MNTGNRSKKQQKLLDNKLLQRATTNDVSGIERAIQAGANIDVRNASGWTPLAIAAHKGRAKAVKSLLEAGADVNAFNEFNYHTPLYKACNVSGSAPYAVANLLLAAGADPTLKDKDYNQYWTAINVARNKGFAALADAMQAIVDDPSQRPTPQSVGLDINKRIAALEALGKPLGKCTQEEITRTAQREARDAINRKLLDAALAGDVSRIEQALQAGADIDVKDTWNGTTPLGLAAYKGYDDAVKYLLEAGADLGGALHSACGALRSCSDTGINILLAAGADVGSRDQWGRSAISIAQQYSDAAIADHLQSIIDDPSRRPTPESVGLDITKRIIALEALGKPLGKFTQMERRRLEQRQTREAQRQEALDSPSGGI